ncbi:hypothetical protein [Streptomonospora litoralis]|uniref:Uncharacterized protein n=1 Tax=Streptomonospora litoralis TaxID=2498135 RepID=A0A4V0ZK23_9ACTN|nr:hypothetical protein [Streptomonospora litoralis]QBI55482.1 hypothetical protein EKD16_18590 [Streptomonospora litoralis]
MAWDVDEDGERYRAAYALQREVGMRWLIMWGPGSRAFWAFHRGPASIVPRSASTPQRLLDEIAAVERSLTADRPPDNRR